MKTMALMKSAILCGDTVTETLQNEFDQSVKYLKSIESDLDAFDSMPI